MVTRVRDPERFMQIVDAASVAFARTGFHRTQVSDIAAEAGTALGTLYRFVESKETLFACALTHGMGEYLGEADLMTPVHDIESYFEERSEEWFDAFRGEYEPHLATSTAPAPVAEGFASIYDAIARRRIGIRIIDRSAHDLPQLGELYVTRGREPVLRDLVAYLESLEQAQVICRLESPATSARFVIESCAWFAMHRHFSPGGVDILDDVARRTTIAHLSSAFTPIPTARG